MHCDWRLCVAPMMDRPDLLGMARLREGSCTRGVRREGVMCAILRGEWPACAASRPCGWNDRCPAMSRPSYCGALRGDINDADGCRDRRRDGSSAAEHSRSIECPEAWRRPYTLGSVLADVRGYLLAKIEDEELAVAARLLTINVRAARAVAGVVLESHLQRVSANQKIEAALITDDRAITGTVRSLIMELARQSVEIDEIKVSKKKPESSRRNNVSMTQGTASNFPGLKLPSGKESAEEGRRRQRAHRAVISVLKKHGVRPNNPRVLSLRNKTVVYTGIFDFGTQDECARATSALGGQRSPSNNLTREVDVLVIGIRASPNYLWKTHGRKIARAKELWQQWRRPLIVTEDRRQKAIGR